MCVFDCVHGHLSLNLTISYVYFGLRTACTGTHMKKTKSNRKSASEEKMETDSIEESVN